MVTKNGRLIGSWHWQFGSWILFDSCFLGNFCLIFIKFISKYSKLTNIKHQTWRHGSNGANIPQLYDYRTLHVYWELSRWNIQGSFYIANPNKPLLFSGSPSKLSYICNTFASNLIPPRSHLMTPDSLLPILQSPQVSGSSRRLPKVPVSGFRGGGGAGVSWRCCLWKDLSVQFNYPPGN